MSFKIDITITPPDLYARLRGKLEHRTPLNARLATRVRQVVQDNFLVRERQPNRNNWKKTGYFQRYYNNTKVGVVDDDHAEVVIADPDRSLARKLNPSAGPITPKESKYLAIPAREEAYGKSPRSFDDLKFVPFGRSGVAALVQRDQTQVSFGKRKKKDGSRTVKRGQELGGLVFYWLVQSSNPPPDPKVLPPLEAVGKAVEEELKAYVEEIKSNG